MWRSSPFYLKAGREELWTARQRSSVRRAVWHWKEGQEKGQPCRWAGMPSGECEGLHQVDISKGETDSQNLTIEPGATS